MGNSLFSIFISSVLVFVVFLLLFVGENHLFGVYSVAEVFKTLSSSGFAFKCFLFCFVGFVKFEISKTAQAVLI